jgi:hypothetical protein
MTQKIETKKVILILSGLILLSVLGTSAYYTSSNKFPFGLSPTGYATSGASYATVDISGSLAITIPDNHVNLSGHVDAAANPGAYVNTNASSAIINSFDNSTNENWLNVSDGAARKIKPDNITVNNTGSVVANITLSSAATPAAFFGAAGDFWVKITNASEGDGTGCQHIQAVSLIQYSDNTSDLCGRLAASDGTDEIDLWIQWQVPSAASAGAYNSTLTISAAQAG